MPVLCGWLNIGVCDGGGEVLDAEKGGLVNWFCDGANVWGKELPFICVGD